MELGNQELDELDRLVAAIIEAANKIKQAQIDLARLRSISREE